MKLTHPRSKVVVETDPSRVRLYISQGWKVQAATASESAALPPCLTCEAALGEPCVTASGSLAAKPHAARLDATQ